MDTLALLGWSWYHYILIIVLVALIVFYVMYRRKQMG